VDIAEIRVTTVKRVGMDPMVAKVSAEKPDNAVTTAMPVTKDAMVNQDAMVVMELPVETPPLPRST